MSRITIEYIRRTGRQKEDRDAMKQTCERLMGGLEGGVIQRKAPWHIWLIEDRGQ